MLTTNDYLLRAMLAHAHTQAMRQGSPLGTAYATPMEFVLQEGAHYVPTPVPPEVRMAPTYCYGNSLIVATAIQAPYVEGYALLHLPPEAPQVFPHAWVAEGALALELTWPVPGLAYLGVQFAIERADEAIWYGDGAILQDHKRGWPILQQHWQGEPPGQTFQTTEWLALGKAGRWAEAKAWSQTHR